MLMGLRAFTSQILSRKMPRGSDYTKLLILSSFNMFMCHCAPKK
jgi:hypothetical protein